MGCLWACLFSNTANATHIRAADIKVEPDCSRPFTYKITVVAYLNTLSGTRFGTSGELFFGNGSSVRIPVTTATPRPDLGTNIGIATFTTTYTYSGPGTYRIAYIERDRSSGILNIANSHDVPYVTFVEFAIDARDNCNTVPVLAVVPLDRACFKSTFFHTSGAYDVDGDSLSYELSIPASGLNTLAAYTSPVHSGFTQTIIKAMKPALEFRFSQSILLTGFLPGMPQAPLVNTTLLLKLLSGERTP